MNITHTLHDWRAPEDIEPPMSPRAEPVAVEVETLENRIDVRLPDGRAVWIEIEGPRLRLHCYDGATDAPVDVDILPNAIGVEDGDYLAERRAKA